MRNDCFNRLHKMDVREALSLISRVCTIQYNTMKRWEREKAVEKGHYN